jgi:hypothetical protein
VPIQAALGSSTDAATDVTCVARRASLAPGPGS